MALRTLRTLPPLAICWPVYQSVCLSPVRLLVLTYTCMSQPPDTFGCISSACLTLNNCTLNASQSVSQSVSQPVYLSACRWLNAYVPLGVTVPISSVV